MDNILSCDATKILLISDVHYGIKSGSENNINYIKWMDMMDDYFENFLTPIINDIKDKGEKPALIICGDFFDNRISIRVDVMNRAVETVRRLSLVCPIYLLAGNHDCYHSEDAEVNSFQVFSGLNVNIIDRDTAIVFKNGESMISFEAFPWTSVNKILSDKIKNSLADYVVIHADVNGLKYASNVEITNGVKVDGFSGRRVFSGHIHKRQESKKVTYVGCPYQMDKSDVGNIKGVYIVSRDKDGKFVEEFIENTRSPKFFAYTYEEFVTLAKSNPDELKNNYVEISYEKAQKADVGILMNKAEDFGCASIIFNYIDDDIEVAELSDAQKSTSIKDTTDEYINNMSIDEDKKKFLLEKNREYFDKIKNS